MTETSEFSRPASMATAVAGHAEQRHQFTEKRVLLTGEKTILTTPNGFEMFRASFLLLVRFCKNVTIALPPNCADIRKDVEQLALDVALPSHRIIYCESGDEFSGFDAVLSVGMTRHDRLPLTVINSDGWIARVSSIATALPTGSNRTNPVGAIGAACLGAAEVFKRLIALHPDRGQFYDNLAFSFWTYSQEFEDIGPDLREVELDLLLAGCGAIGCGTTYLLSRLRISGHATLLDKGTFGPENFGTSILIGRQHYDHAKAEVAASVLSGLLTTQHYNLTISDFAAQNPNQVPEIILNGLDEIEPRHEIQHLWPMLVIDGATGPDLSCQVSCHSWQENVACVLCTFVKPTRSLAEMNARATGLPCDIANDPDAVVTESIIAAATKEKQPWLRTKLGKKMCSITSEAVALWLSLEMQSSSFAPAAPFVACFSSCMIVAELLRFKLTGATFAAPRFQVNLLWGPQRGVLFDQERTPTCYCVERRANIDRLRHLRELTE